MSLEALELLLQMQRQLESLQCATVRLVAQNADAAERRRAELAATLSGPDYGSEQMPQMPALGLVTADWELQAHIAGRVAEQLVAVDDVHRTLRAARRDGLGLQADGRRAGGDADDAAAQRRAARDVADAVSELLAVAESVRAQLRGLERSVLAG